MAREYPGKIKAKRVTVDKYPLAPGRFSLRIIPVKLLFKVGQVIPTIMLDTIQESREDLIKRAC
jgi:thioredoxin-like negative regulator of GroEL